MRIASSFALAIIVNLAYGANTRGGAEGEQKREDHYKNVNTKDELTLALSSNAGQGIGAGVDTDDFEDARLEEFEGSPPSNQVLDFEEHFSAEESRRLQNCDCVVEEAEIEFFDITVSIHPESPEGECTQADQNFLGNEINLLLLEYGVGEAGSDDDSQFLARVCSHPSSNRRLELDRSPGYVWTGAGACRGCPTENNDKRRSLAEIRNQDTTISANDFDPSDGDERETTARELASNSQWFYNEFKPEMEATVETAIKNDLVHNHRDCLGINPNVDVDVVGITLDEVDTYCGTTDGGALPLLDTIGHSDWVLSFGRNQCGTCVHLDFSRKADGVKYRRGEWISKTEYQQKHGLTITAKEKGVRDTKDARIFNTSNPGSNENNGDPDLGSPNKACGGLGVGEQGKPGKRGENCIPIGNALIIQDPNSLGDNPNDNPAGGKITFTFDDPVLISDIGLMDIEDGDQRIQFTYQGGFKSNFSYEGYGDNSVQRVIANKFNVRKVDIYLMGTGAVTELNFCPDC